MSEVDYNLYPSRKLQEQWLRSYLEAYKEYKGFGTDVTEKEVELLYVQVNQFALVSLDFILLTPGLGACDLDKVLDPLVHLLWQ